IVVAMLVCLADTQSCRQQHQLRCSCSWPLMCWSNVIAWAWACGLTFGFGTEAQSKLRCQGTTVHYLFGFATLCARLDGRSRDEVHSSAALGPTLTPITS